MSRVLHLEPLHCAQEGLTPRKSSAQGLYGRVTLASLARVMSKTNVVRVMLRSALIIAAAGALVVFAATAPIGPGTNTARAGGPVVTRADDPAPDGCKPGDCSVREALEDASGGQTISFNIAGAGPHVIKPTSELPGLVDSVSIDGYTQPGASPNTATAWNAGNASMRIVLDGSLAGAGVNGLSHRRNGRAHPRSRHTELLRERHHGRRLRQRYDLRKLPRH